MGMWSNRQGFNKVALVNETQARRLCEQRCTQNPDVPRLRHIATVGAYDGVIGGAGVDSRRLTAVMAYLLQSGFMIDPDFQVDVVNFRQSRDFLREETKADMVFVSFILASVLRNTLVYDVHLNAVAEQSQDYRHTYGIALSDRHNIEVWRRRIAQSGAEMVVTYGGKDEIGTHNLCVTTINHAKGLDDIVPLIKTPQHQIALHARHVADDKDVGGFEMKTNTPISVLYNNAANDLPMPWLGFAARVDYLKNAAPALSDKTTLGGAGRHIARFS